METWIAADPRAFSARASSTVWSRSQPSSTQSVAETRIQTGFPAGTTSRTASNTSRGEAHPVLQAAAIRILAPVGERREELVQQVAVGTVQLEPVDAEPQRALGRRHEAVAHAPEAFASSAWGATSPSAWATAEGASVRQPSGSSGAICAPPSHGTRLEAFRPAWLIWIATGIGAYSRIASSTRPSARSVASS